jgi:predicted phosphoadenosine phosphosulfate sulfurtransferase
MKIYKNKNVYEEALDRIRLLYDEFPLVMVSLSGGKDSTVILELTKIVARERNALPVKVMWLDQECEFEATVDYVKTVMYDPEVEPMWYQIPFKLLNATSATESWLNVWGEGEEWVREKDPISIKENTFGTDRFVKLMEAIVDKSFDHPVAVLTGVRTEESPARFMGATGDVTYKWITWGNTINKKKGIYNFHPIYDWTYIDVWKAIYDHNWNYNRHYDELFRYGTPVRKMRVSNYHHETAVHSLFLLQEVEPQTYEKATKRISGIDTAGKMGKEDWFVYELPFMFNSWTEYRDYLVEHLIEDPKVKKTFQDYFESVERRYSRSVGEDLYKTQINSILCNDVELTKLKNWETRSFTDDQLAEKEAHEHKLAEHFKG